MNFSFGNTPVGSLPKSTKTSTPTTASEYIQGKGSPTDKSPFTKDDPYTGPMPLGNPNTGKGNLFFEIVDSIVHGTPPDDIKSPFGREDYSSPAPITLLGDDAIKELTQDQARAELKDRTDNLRFGGRLFRFKYV